MALESKLAFKTKIWFHEINFLPTQIFRPSAVSTLETKDLCLHSYSRTDNWQMQFYLYFSIKKNNFFDFLPALLLTQLSCA